MLSCLWQHAVDSVSDFYDEAPSFVQVGPWWPSPVQAAPASAALMQPGLRPQVSAALQCCCIGCLGVRMLVLQS